MTQPLMDGPPDALGRAVPPPATATTAAPPGGSGADKFEGLRTAKIMLVDDEPITLEVIMEFLEEAGYSNFVAVSDPRDALGLIDTERPDVIMLDLMMPHISGFDILSSLRDSDTLKRLPVIVLTSSTDAATKLKALELGATDFLAKPVDQSELILRLRNTLASKAYQDQLAYYDPLTGLPNRTKFADHLEWSLRQAQRYKRLCALLHIYIDNFKKITGALGPALSDDLLKTFAKRLEKVVRTSDSLARNAESPALLNLSRLGADEFTILLVEIKASDDASMVCQRILDATSQPFTIGEHVVHATCSVGVAIFPNDGSDSENLLRSSGIAVNFAMKQGGDNFRFYSSELNEQSLKFVGLQSDLYHAIDRKEFQLFYQPKVDVLSGKLVAAEALIRWLHPVRGMVRPDTFIPLAEETGLIVHIGQWVLEEACRNVRKLLELGWAAPRIAINVSGRQFRENEFLPTVKKIIGDSGVDPGILTIEMTESMLMGSAEDNIKMLQDLKNLGLRLSIDDFGTGYSSLSYLSRFPLDELKIDKSFIDGVTVDGTRESKAIVIAIIALAHGLGLKVVAEGIEKPDQLAFLQQNRCDEYQGYLFSRPVSFLEFCELLRTPPG